MRLSAAAGSSWAPRRRAPDPRMDTYFIVFDSTRVPLRQKLPPRASNAIGLVEGRCRLPPPGGTARGFLQEPVQQVLEATDRPGPTSNRQQNRDLFAIHSTRLLSEPSGQ